MCSRNFKNCSLSILGYNFKIIYELQRYHTPFLEIKTAQSNESIPALRMKRVDILIWSLKFRLQAKTQTSFFIERLDAAARAARPSLLVLCRRSKVVVLQPEVVEYAPIKSYAVEFCDEVWKCDAPVQRGLAAGIWNGAYSLSDLLSSGLQKAATETLAVSLHLFAGTRCLTLLYRSLVTNCMHIYIYTVHRHARISGMYVLRL